MRRRLLLSFCALAFFPACPDSPSSGMAPARLSVRRLGDGKGAVRAPGLACGDDCTLSATAGTVVELLAVPDFGAAFAGWSDGCGGLDPVCTLTLNAGDTNVGATFIGAPPTASWQREYPRPIRGGAAAYGLFGFGARDVWIGGFPTLLRWDGVALAADLETPVPLRSLWGSAADDLWAVGDAGALRHYDGSWSTAKAVTTRALGAIFGSARDDIYAAGQGGTLLHYDGSSWSALLTGIGEDITALWAPGRPDGMGTRLWIGGESGGLWRYDGREYKAVPTGSRESVRSLSGSAPDDVWIAGGGGLLLRWDGARLVEPAPGRSESFAAVFVRGPREVWLISAVGALLRWDGASLSQVAKADAPLSQLWVGAADDVWLSGAGGAVLHWDGVKLAPPKAATLRALWGAPGAVYAAGDGGALLRRDDGVWRALPGPTRRDLRGLWVSPSGTLWIVGEDGTIARGARGGQSAVDWTLEASGTSVDLRAVWGYDDGNAWAVGKAGTVLHRDGRGWSPVESGTGADLTHLSGNAADVWIGGAGGTVLRLDGPRFVPLRAAGADLFAAGSAAPEDLWLVGAGGTVLRWDGQALKPFDAGTTEDLWALWASRRDRAAIAGAQGTVLLWDGRALRKEAALETALRGLWGDARGQLFAAGDEGLIFGRGPL